MNSNKPVIVFDWDGVIFDTELFRKVVARALKRSGYADDLVTETFDAAAHGAPGYGALRHGRLLQREKLHSAEEIARIIYTAINKHRGNFVFADARRMLVQLKREKCSIDILTSGDREFQEFKIVRSKLRRIFRDIHVVEWGERVGEAKVQVLDNLLKSHERLYFLDDRPQNVVAVHKASNLRGRVLPVLVWREKGKPPAGLLVLRRLSWRELQKIAIRHPFRAY